MQHAPAGQALIWMGSKVVVIRIVKFLNRIFLHKVLTTCLILKRKKMETYQQRRKKSRKLN